MDQNQRWTSQSFANWPHSTPVHPKKTRFLFCAVKQHGTGPWCVSLYLWKSRRGHLRLEVGVVDQVYSSKGKGLAESRFRTKSGWSLGSFQAELNLHDNHESGLDFHEAKGLANGYLANRLQTSEEIKILDLNPWPIDFCGKNMKKTCLPGTCLQKRLLSNTGLFNL